jgi:acyl-CoA thioesterase I
MARAENSQEIWRARRFGILAGLIAAVCAALPARAELSAVCRVPDVYLTLSNPLDHTLKRIDHARGFTVLVIGPPIGEAGGDGVPGRLERELEKRLPHLPMSIRQTRGATGLAQDDFEAIRQAFSDGEGPPDLVIWQVGVTDAITAFDVQDFGDAVDGAREWIEARGVDVILIDPPFVPNVAHEKIYWSYVGEIGAVSEEEDVPVFRRYATTRYWDIERERAGRPAGGNDMSKPCVAEVVAEAISRAVKRQMPPRTVNQEALKR